VARLTPDNEQRARDLIALYPYPRSALIPILHVAQEQDGYLCADAMAHVGELLGLTAAEVRGTATFYDMFHTEPVGRYLVAVCTNIACMLQGAYQLLEHIEERLEIAPGGTTTDKMFTLEDAECLALCGNAPCLTVNWRFFGDVDPQRFDTLVEDLRAGRTVGLQAAGASIHGAGGPSPARPSPSPPRPAPEPGAGGVRLTTAATTGATASLDGGLRHGPGEGRA